MKKWILWLLIGALLLGCWGCAPRQEKLTYPIRFYYLPDEYTFGAADSVFEWEAREGNGMQNDLNALLTLYLQGPQSQNLHSPFPSGTELLHLDRMEDTLHITLSEEFASIQGFKLTLACAALTKTVLELTDCVNVRITAETATLNGKKFIIMNAENLLLLDNIETTPTTSEQ